MTPRAQPSVWPLLVLAACAGGGETGNPVVDARLELSARSSEPRLIALSGGADGSVLDEAWVAFGDPALLNDAECARFGDLDAPGASVLVAELTEPGASIDIAVATGAYCGLLIPLSNQTRALPSGAPAELSRHSVVLRGARADGTPFLLTYPEQDELELAAAERIAIDADGPRLLLAFDVAVWMDGVDLDGAEPAQDGVIHIDAQQNRPLLDAFELNLECSLELFADEDEDGELDAGEPRLAECAPD